MLGLFMNILLILINDCNPDFEMTFLLSILMQK
jgi:hypothetical protein